MMAICPNLALHLFVILIITLLSGSLDSRSSFPEYHVYSFDHPVLQQHLHSTVMPRASCEIPQISFSGSSSDRVRDNQPEMMFIRYCSVRKDWCQEIILAGLLTFQQRHKLSISLALQTISRFVIVLEGECSLNFKGTRIPSVPKEFFDILNDILVHHGSLFAALGKNLSFMTIYAISRI